MAATDKPANRDALAAQGYPWALLGGWRARWVPLDRLMPPWWGAYGSAGVVQGGVAVG